MNSTRFKIIGRGNVFALILLALSFISQVNAQKIARRGIVVYPSDLISLGADKWIALLETANLNLLGIHTDSRFERIPDLKNYIDSEDGQKLFRLCKERGIDVEFEMHALQDILPRDMFLSHPEYFRMNADGKRVQEYNMCFTSEGAYKEMEKIILELAKWLKPTTNRFFFWTDDYTDAFCHCEKCSKYSASEQALIYENHLLKILRKANPKATVAHLAYNNTLEAPKKVKPLKGVFLEYAPINRNYELPLTEEHISNLKSNLKVFPRKTAHILEYWLDASMFCGWNRNKRAVIPWNKEFGERDVNAYFSLGIRSVTSFAAWIDSDYVNQFGQNETETLFKEYGEVLKY